MSTPIEKMDLEQVDFTIAVFEETIKESNRIAEQLRAEGIEEGLIRRYQPSTKIYTALERLDERRKELTIHEQ